MNNYLTEQDCWCDLRMGNNRFDKSDGKRKMKHTFVLIFHIHKGYKAKIVCFGIQSNVGINLNRYYN